MPHEISMNAIQHELGDDGLVTRLASAIRV